MDSVSRRNDEAGMALITTLLVMMLIGALVAGTFAAVTADQRNNMAGRDQTQVYAAAHAGLEKLTSDLATLFASDVSPAPGEIEDLTKLTPDLAGVKYDAPTDGVPGETCYGSGYEVCFETEGGQPKTEAGEISAGPYQGFYGLITPYTITVTAAGAGGAEVRLRRTLQTVAIPAFQFGVFSDSDQTFYAGDDFDFGGRVHTNRNLFLAQAYGRTLTFSDRITAVGEVVRAVLSNGRSIGSVFFTGTVKVPTSIGLTNKYRNLGAAEGSVDGLPGAPGTTEIKTWTKLSTDDYKLNIRNWKTGAKRLELPLVSQGATAIDLIRRPRVDSNENVSNKPVFDQRFFSQASLRILLSDRAADITDLPTVTAAAPVQLEAWTPANAAHPRVAQSPGDLPAVLRTHGTTNSSYSGSLATIVLDDSAASLPARSALEMPTLTVGAQTIPCLGRGWNTSTSRNEFLGCTLTAKVFSGSVISATVEGTVVTALTSGDVNAGSNRTIPVTGSTALFSPRIFNYLWATDAQGPTPIWCDGYDNRTSPMRLTRCAGLTGAPARGSLVSTYARVDAATPLVAGFIKIEKQSDAGVWTDVTTEILNLGIGAPNQVSGTLCADPTPDAVLRLQRLRDNGGGGCLPPTGATRPATDWWPNALYDAREGNYRDVPANAGMTVGGVMHYVSLDVGNLQRWLTGAIGTTGTEARDDNGYIVYFSDRRGDHQEDAVGDPETGEYGFEDVVNPASADGNQNGVLDPGEDANLNGELDSHGERPYDDPSVIPASAAAPFNADATPWTPVGAGEAAVNRQVLFRRALKLVNGGIASGVNNLPASGLTVAAENPVYVQGNYNATTLSTDEPNVPAAIVADAVTVLSNNWKDFFSFRYPNDRTRRDASTTGYRFAVIAGKNPSFPYPTAGAPYFLFGTDGGAGNFLRLLEDWNVSGRAINYRGSIISLYYSRQATGTFKYNANVYDYGERNFTFDTDFLDPALLPPGTPMFRDVNTLTFRQILRPTE